MPRWEKRVLVLDLDPQSSLGEILVSNKAGNGKIEKLSDLDEKKTLNYVFDLHIARIRKYNNIQLKFDLDIVQTYEKGNFDFIASSLFYRDGVGLDELAVRMEDIKDTIAEKCKHTEVNVCFFEEDINNYIDIARNTEVGQASKAKNDYEELSKSVLNRIANM